MGGVPIAKVRCTMPNVEMAIASMHTSSNPTKFIFLVQF
ncbi:hypothetical protein CKA32_003167 [Geitlerinema sp. FC II]|nr:hypothetical protein CKA32_003167 [Geitlerinema sp. FC II]